jgi:hypothetical protein
VAIPTADGIVALSLLAVFDAVGDEHVIEVPEEYTAFAQIIEPPEGVRVRKINGLVYFRGQMDRLSRMLLKMVLEMKRHQRAAERQQLQRGVYIASRASIPERAARWRHYRDVDGWHIISSWIDEDGEGQTDDFSELWVRIETEIKSAERLILYVESDDFPLKGALIEAGIALAAGVPIYVVAPGVTIEPRSRRPIGSWVDHPLVKIVPDMETALLGATRRAGLEAQPTDAINAAFDRIDAMSDEEFRTKLATYTDGAVAHAFTGMHAAQSTGDQPRA